MSAFTQVINAADNGLTLAGIMLAFAGYLLSGYFGKMMPDQEPQMSTRQFVISAVIYVMALLKVMVFARDIAPILLGIGKVELVLVIFLTVVSAMALPFIVSFTVKWYMKGLHAEFWQRQKARQEH